MLVRVVVFAAGGGDLASAVVFTGVRDVAAVVGFAAVIGLVPGFFAPGDGGAWAPGEIPSDVSVDVLLGFSDIDGVPEEVRAVSEINTSNFLTLT